MKKEKLNPEEFEIIVHLEGASKRLKISPKETTDGVTYFNCNINDINLTQIRKEKNGTWEQIWGKLDPHSINAIGAAITAKTEE